MPSLPSIFKACAVCFSLLSTTINGLASSFDPPIMGWSSWNTYRVNIREELIKKQADAMISQGLKDAGYSFINIDDGFFGYRDDDGKLHTHPERFPGGLKSLSGYIHSLGLKAGIYSDAGSNTCGSIWDKDLNGIGVGLYGYEKEDADLFFNEWKFDFIKIDYCGAGQELSLEERKRYTEIRDAIDKTVGRPVYLNICRWAFPGTWAKNIAQSWRISEDISPTWNSVKHIIEKNLYLAAYAKQGHYNDMDMLEIGRGLKREEEEVHFGLWCIMSSPLLIGCDLTTIPEASLNLLKNKELIALNQDPLGLQAYVVSNKNGGYILVKDVEKERSNTRAVAFYNPSDTTCSLYLDLKDIELGGKVEVKDLLRGRFEGRAINSLTYTLAPRSVKIIKLKAEKRLEPVKYEAEWAYLPEYSDLGTKKKQVHYAYSAEASGKRVIRFVGGSSENYAEWDNVYSEKGGKYELTISYLPEAQRKLEVDVNGTKVTGLKLETFGGKGIATVTAHVNLKAGKNIIKMGSSRYWAPDLDAFTLKPLRE